MVVDPKCIKINDDVKIDDEYIERNISFNLLQTGIVIYLWPILTTAILRNNKYSNASHCLTENPEEMLNRGIV